MSFATEEILDKKDLEIFSVPYVMQVRVKTHCTIVHQIRNITTPTAD